MDYWKIDKEKLYHLAKKKGYCLKTLSQMCGMHSSYLSAASTKGFGVDEDIIIHLEKILEGNITKKNSKTSRINHKKIIKLMLQGLTAEETAEKLKLSQEAVIKVYIEEGGNSIPKYTQKIHIIRTSSGLMYK